MKKMLMACMVMVFCSTGCAVAGGGTLVKDDVQYPGVYRVFTSPDANNGYKMSPVGSRYFMEPGGVKRGIESITDNADGSYTITPEPLEGHSVQPLTIGRR